MNKFLIFISFLFLNQLVFAQGDVDILGGKSAGMGKTSVAVADVWSVSNNQAGLAFLKDAQIGIYYNNSFTTKNTGFQTIAMAVPTKKTGTFGINVSYFGYSDYNESKIAFAYGKKLGEKFGVGIKINYFNLQQAEGYGNKSLVIGEIGLMGEPTKNLFIGAHLYNITRTMLVKDDVDDNVNVKVEIPTVLRIGIGYKFNDNVFAAAEVEKDLTNTPVFKAGLDYKVVEKFYLRAGLSTYPTSSTFGIAYKTESLNIDLSFATHQNLGMTPHISVSYIFE